jgi:hypothetical protein
MEILQLLFNVPFNWNTHMEPNYGWQNKKSSSLDWAVVHSLINF